MKKTMAIILAMLMTFSFASCGSTSSSSDKDSSKESANSTSDGSDSSKESVNDTSDGADSSEESGNNTVNGIDMSKYPADFNEWTAQNLVDYFNEAVDFPGDCETWVQDHASYWAGMPVYECAGVWNADGAGDVCVMFFVFNPDSPDTTPEAVEEVKQKIRDDANHDYTTEDLNLGPQDHMIGNVSFCYGMLTLNEEVYNDVEAAYNDLVKALGVTPDF